ncbi:hypothetical protein HPB48_019488 [Haemaphysalis longicornis]|uniref:Uncharacterized protein n=1 Tax=Haemaphysalis longicornis TaxID=44386 RepID=A0A9J6FAL0_HAELO|nr:hypothetical protein HPB48_019488 [Haemaphysalis longicornis]
MATAGQRDVRRYRIGKRFSAPVVLVLPANITSGLQISSTAAWTHTAATSKPTILSPATYQRAPRNNRRSPSQSVLPSSPENNHWPRHSSMPT